jgi:hypothetical protein
MRQSEALASELPQASQCGLCEAIVLNNHCYFLPEAGSVTVRATSGPIGFEWDQRIPTGKRSFANSR